MQPDPAQPQMVSYAIGGAILLLVLVLRFRNIGRHRRLRLETLWIVPTILGVAAVATFTAAPPSPLTIGLSLGALLIGSAVGWQRGRLMEIHVDPETHELNQVASFAGMLFIAAIIAIRFGGRMLIESGVLPVHADPRAITDVLLSFAVGLIGVARLEMFQRARRLLAGARNGTEA